MKRDDHPFARSIIVRTVGALLLTVVSAVLVAYSLVLAQAREVLQQKKGYGKILRIHKSEIKLLYILMVWPLRKVL